MTRKRAFTLTDLIAWIATAVVLLAIILPCLGQAHAGGFVRYSLAHLMEHSIAHTMYAADWNGRQYTNIVDDISIYGAALVPAFENYRVANGGEPHPPVLLGDDADGNPWGFYMFTSGNYLTAPPMSFTGNFAGFGHFRLTNAKPFHDYMADPRFYAPAFYAVTDTIPYPNVKPLINEPGEFVPNGSNLPFYSSYVTSPAAMFDPDVMRSELDGGWVDPWSIDHGHTSPPLTAALYPDLKTHVLEHHWIQNAPADPCNPAFVPGVYPQCEPYYFNHALASAPATLFYDGSVRVFPNGEAREADQQQINQTGVGLWSRDTPFGNDGYFIEYGFDDSPLSHHILTTDGIRGRDTIAQD